MGWVAEVSETNTVPMGFHELIEHILGIGWERLKHLLLSS